MSLLDLIKDKFTDAELKARIQKELRQSTLDAVQELKTDPGVQANLLKGAIDKMYPYKENIDILACEIISNKYFQKLLEEKITEIILSLVNTIQSSSIQQKLEDGRYMQGGLIYSSYYIWQKANRWLVNWDNPNCLLYHLGKGDIVSVW